MTNNYPDAVTTTPSSIEFGFGLDGDRLAFQIVTQLPPPIGALRINLATGQAGTLYATLGQFATLTDDQTAELVAAINDSMKEN